ncbi:MAG: two-component system phosphate regulon sensor histidine kinase PhoR [Patiriisocius sp.]|jgi:two-component system phosphate regulon sensor histidine kinase PhoR
MAKFSYRRKLQVYYLSVFVIFLLITGTFQYLRERTFRTGQLETSLNDIGEMSRKYIEKHRLFEINDFARLDSLKSIFPQKDARLTIIGINGNVMYDSSVNDYLNLENHGSRPEIIDAATHSPGVSVRKSATTGLEYYYYAKNIGKYYIRSSVIYDVNIINFLKANRLFFYFIFGLFLLVWGLLFLVTRKFSLSISKLRDLAVGMGENSNPQKLFAFEDDEIGEISHELVNVYGNLQKTRDQLSVEKERIYRHLNAVNQGIAIFSSDKELLISNKQFSKYSNLLSDKSLKNETDIFKVSGFEKLNTFIDMRIGYDGIKMSNQKVEKLIKIEHGNRFFNIRCIIFIDKSFEIIITNITRKEKSEIIKNEMSSNIAHELKTPVAAIQAYLETIINKPELEDEKKIHFLHKAHGQVERLGSLISDISTVYKMESTKDVFKKDEFNLFELINEIIENTQIRLDENKMKLSHNIFSNLLLSANRELILSIFQNLIDNSINYAGENTNISISMYKEDKYFYHFSYSDDGIGIEDEHLDRIFERFYRVDIGRTRKSGGTGIGLAIVNNAVKFHKGEISAKSKKDGGVEFLFSLRKI